MRITCPNCSAQYEIDAELIPSEGRDVQCSNCGTAWFQEDRPRATTAAQTRAGRRTAPQSTLAGRDADADGRPGRAARRIASKEPEPDGGADAGRPHLAPAADAGARPGMPRRPTADQATLDILREERAREDRLRAIAASASGPDAQPEPISEPVRNDDPAASLALATDDAAEETRTPAAVTASPRDPREAAADERARVAAAAALARARRGESASGPATPADAASSRSEPPRQTSRASPTDPAGMSGRLARRDLLPDIERINSSLRPDDVPVEAGPARASGAARRRGGFRSGFLVTASLLAIPVAIYVFHEPLGRAVPGAAQPLADYADWVDMRRIALDGWVQALAERIPAAD